MSDLGIPDSTFLELQQKWFTNKKQPPHNTQYINLFFRFDKQRMCFFYYRDLLKNKLPLPVNECRYMFGCALESKLEPGQCFIRYQVLDDNGKPRKDQKFETVVGQVIVTKNPW